MGWTMQWRTGKVVRGVLTAFLVLSVLLPVDGSGLPHARAAIGCSVNPALGPDIVVDGAEITQSVQDGRNRIPLVAGKRTFVRLYSHLFSFRDLDVLRSRRSGRAKRPFPTGSCISDATLTVRNGSSFVTLEPLEDGGLDTVTFKRLNRFQRGDPAFGFLFELPSFATSGTTTLTAEVNPNGTIQENNRANNVLQSTAVFQPVPRLFLNFDRVNYTVGTTRFDTPLEDVAQMARQIQREYPVPGVDWRARSVNVGTRTVDADRNFTDLTCDDLNMDRLINELGLFVIAEQASNRRLYSMIDDAGGFMTGCALIDEPPFGPIASGPTGTPGGNWSWDTDGIYGDWYGAHEIGHTMNRRHVRGGGDPILCSGNEPGPGPWPYPNGLISPQGSDADAIVGFDVETRETYPFDVGHDLMTYCPEQWVSDVSYKKLRERIVTAGPTGEEPPFDGGDDICVAGTFGIGKKPSPAQTRLLPTFGGDATLDGTKSKHASKGKFAIELRDAAGELIVRERFTPYTSRPGPAYLGARVKFKKTRIVLHCLPFDARVNEVVVTGPGRTPLGTIKPGPNAPTVEVLPPGPIPTPTPTPTPTGSPVPTPTKTPDPTPTPIGERQSTAAPVEETGALHLEWNASDPDGDVLSHLVQASTDSGQTWRTVALPTSATSVDIPRDNLESGPNLFRVLTTDRLHLAVDVLRDLVILPDNPPLLEIRTPTVSQRVRSRQTLSLEAFAYDFSTGNLDGTEVRWTSDRDGFLGTGDQISVTGLSPGGHSITVQATTPDGTASRTVPIVVE